jgi:peptidoglycan glycosyltransferase
MNSPIVHLYGLLLILFAALVGFTSYWAVLDADNLKDNPQNRRPLIAEQTVKRGTITTADGVTIAESFPVGGGKNPVYVREYPQGSLFGNPVGYSFIEAGRVGIERAENGFLAGERSEFTSIIDQIRGVPQEGDDLTLTIDAGTQEVATQALESAIASTAGAAGAGGSVVAIDPSTGAVRVMASVPGFDPNLVDDPATLKELNRDQSAPLVNRPTQSTYEPGSTMKVVTAAAALDSGEFTPETVLSGSSPQEIGGVPLSNAGGQSFGDIDMTTALTNSVNTYWAQVGEKLGNETMFKYMDRFGFNKDPELGYPDGQMAPSGLYSEGNLLSADDRIDIGRAAIGQERLLTTPLQMAEVAATVANGGVLMRPTFVQEVTDPDGRTVQKLDPHEQATVISEQTASQLTEMMTNVTAEGTAVGLTVGGLPFAGKTGTAEIDPATGINRPWFIGFAPTDDPQVAVAVMLERGQSCFGGEVAGPIATQVMESLLNR